MVKQWTFTDLYFVYKEGPFRPLYHGYDATSARFAEPPTATERSLRPKAWHVWFFKDEGAARLVAQSNWARYATKRRFNELAAGRTAKPSKRSALDELA